MFDGAPTTSRHETTELDRLRAIYDGLLAAPPVAIDEAAAAELAGMARIFDLDADRPAPAVWRDLRAVLSRQGEPSDAGADDAPPETPPLTLMVVEDDPEMAADLTALLVESGHHVVGPFRDAASATAAAGLHALDLALLDINLDGEGDGVDLARTLTGAWGVPVMFLSGDVTAAARHARLATALVMKPYRGREVLDAIARAVQSGAVAA